MSAIRTFTVTVVSTDSGNKYVIDGVQQDTINLAEGYTYLFNYPSAHPFRFSTTSDGTHNSGSEYTTGVTVNSSTQVQITVAASAPTLYYYCSIHPNMGGQANTVDANAWGMLQWGQNEWSDQNSVDLTLTAPSGLSSAVGSVEAFSETGWGSDTWGVENWGASGLTLELTAPTQMIGEVGEFENAGTLVGWGRNGWGEEPYGDSFNDLVQPAGVGASVSVGSLTTVQMTVGLTAPSEATSGIGSILTEITVPITAPSGATASVGSLTDEITVPITAPSGATAGVGGIILDAIEIGLTAPSGLTASVGSIGETIGQVLSGQVATSSVGSIVPEIVVPISTAGVGTSAVGAISPDQITVGLSSLEATSSVGQLGIRAYVNVDIDGNTSYNNVDLEGNTSYTDVNAAQEKLWHQVLRIQVLN